jgi:K+-transporting ATPase KdpF subunit
VSGVDVENIVLLVIAGALVVYLLVALLDPERF